MITFATTEETSPCIVDNSLEVIGNFTCAVGDRVFELPFIDVISGSVAIWQDSLSLLQGPKKGSRDSELYLKRQQDNVFISSRMTQTLAVASLSEFVEAAQKHALSLLTNYLSQKEADEFVMRFAASPRRDFDFWTIASFYEESGEERNSIYPEKVHFGFEQATTHDLMGFAPHAHPDKHGNFTFAPDATTVEKIAESKAFWFDDWLGDDLVLCQGMVLASEKFAAHLVERSNESIKAHKISVQKSNEFPEVEAAANRSTDHFWLLEGLSQNSDSAVFIDDFGTAINASSAFLKSLENYKLSYARLSPARTPFAPD